MKDNIKSYDGYKESSLRNLIDELENKIVKVDTLNDCQIDNLISYYSYNVKLKHEKIKNIREVYKNGYNKSRMHFN